MKITEIRTKTNKELFSIIDSLKAELLALRFQSATGQIEKTHELKEVKRNIAKVYTVIFENNLENKDELKSTRKNNSNIKLNFVDKKADKKTSDNSVVDTDKPSFDNENVKTSIILNNKNIFLGKINGEWTIINKDGKEIKSGFLKNKKDILTSLVLENKNISLGQKDNHWTIIDQKGKELDSGILEDMAKKEGGKK